MRRPGHPSVARGVSQRVLARLREALDGLDRSFDLLSADPEPSAEQLHRLHADLRRLRVGFRLLRSLEPAAARPRLKVLDRRLAEIARRVGEVRDRDVLLGLLGGAEEALRGPASSPAPGDPLPELLLRLKDDARIGRELIRAYVRTEKDSGLFDELGHLLEVTPSLGALATFPRAELDRVGRPLVRAARKARRRLTRGRAHALRVRLRRMRHLLELLGPIPGARGGRYPDRLVRLQRLLGQLHDRDNLADWVEELPAGLRSAPWAKRLRGEHRAVRRRLADELAQRGLREAIRSLGAPSSER
jgi:CHAD domain-containing protein